MTVAAVILVPEPPAALVPVEGEPALRRLAQAAWSGGALPTVVVAADASDDLRRVVSDMSLTLTVPAADEPRGVAWFVNGLRTAVETVSETTAALLWPFRYVWVDPETVTSLVEAHGAAADSILRPAYGGQVGFPILFPAALLDRLSALSGQHAEEAVQALIDSGVSIRQIELGDPGIVLDISTARGDLPFYQGPPEPAAGPPPEWNSVLAAQAGESLAAEEATE